MESFIRPPAKLGVFFIFFLNLSGCAYLDTFLKRPVEKSFEHTMSNADYIDQINFQGEIYLQQNRKRILSLSKRTRAYFSNLVLKIKSANEKYFLEGEQKYTLYVLKDERPYYFALPNGKIVFSLGIIKKYIDNESVLAMLVTKLIYISSKNLYLKKISIPKGVLDTIEMMKIVDLPLDVRREVNKWTFYLMSRAELDGLAVLNWIQIQNKNILDFSLMYKDLNIVSKEEFEFKNFMTTQRNRSFLKSSSNSSKDFYMFRKEISRYGAFVPVRRTSY